IFAEIDGFKANFKKSMEDDLNTADGIASLFEIVKTSNTKLDEKSSRKLIEHIYDTLMELSKVLGILSKEEEILEEEIVESIEKRSEARKNKDFKLADSIRDELKEKGIIIEDTKDGVKWKRV